MANKVIVITGASEGIGAATAKHLAELGHQVVVAARREGPLALVVADCGGRAIGVTADMTCREDVMRLRDRAIEVYGRVDVWINNVGQGITRPVMELSDEDVDAMIAVNIKSALYGMQAIVPHFQVRGDGQVINISSFLGRVPAATIRSVYSAAKAALNSLTANLRMDLAESHPGIKVTLVMPGMVATGFATNSLNAGASQPYVAGSGGANPVMQVQTPEEVAAVIARVIDAPVAEVFTNLAHTDLAAKYYQDVAGFEARMAAGMQKQRANALAAGAMDSKPLEAAESAP